tara:strand:+ start:95 stop:457 length:363 start_codon:yes stop_codon:yes gene_type:complete
MYLSKTSEFDRYNTLAFKDQPIDLTLRAYGEILAMTHRLKVSTGRTHPPTFVDSVVTTSETFLGLTIGVGTSWISGLLTGVKKNVVQRAGELSRGDPQRTVTPAVRVFTLTPGLHFFEIW